MTESARVIVIGGGVIGAAVVYRLARAGATVTLLDRGQPGRGTSANSFAWVNANRKPPREYHRLNAESMVAHRRLRDDVSADGGRATWLHEGGGLECATGDEGGAALRANTRQLQEWGYRVELIDEAEVARLEPHLCVDGISAATFCPEEAWAEGPQLASNVAATAARLGATLRTGAGVAAIDRDGDRITGVRLVSGERLESDWVVVAAGRWTDEVAALAGVQVPLAPTCGLLAVLNPVPQAVSRVVHVPGMNFRPEPGGGLVVQSGETDATVTADTPPDPGLPGCAQLWQRVQRYLPSAAEGRVAEARVGVRPMPADGFTVAGSVTGRPGLYLAVTHSGVTLSALLGELVAAEVTAGQDDERLAQFRPARCVHVQDL